MNMLRWAVVSSSLITALMTAGCFGFWGSAIGDRASLSSSETADPEQAKVVLQALTRAQQADHLENGQFAETIADLGLGISTETGGYQIAIAEVQTDRVVMTAKTSSLRPPNLSSWVFVLTAPGGNATAAIVCEGATNSENPPPMPQVVSAELVCGENG